MATVMTRISKMSLKKIIENNGDRYVSFGCGDGGLFSGYGKHPNRETMRSLGFGLLRESDKETMINTPSRNVRKSTHEFVRSPNFSIENSIETMLCQAVKRTNDKLMLKSPGRIDSERLKQETRGIYVGDDEGKSYLHPFGYNCTFLKHKFQWDSDKVTESFKIENTGEETYTINSRQHTAATWPLEDLYKHQVDAKYGGKSRCINHFEFSTTVKFTSELKLGVKDVDDQLVRQMRRIRRKIKKIASNNFTSTQIELEIEHRLLVTDTVFRCGDRDVVRVKPKRIFMAKNMNTIPNHSVPGWIIVENEVTRHIDGEDIKSELFTILRPFNKSGTDNPYGNNKFGGKANTLMDDEFHYSVRGEIGDVRKAPYNADKTSINNLSGRITSYYKMYEHWGPYAAIMQHDVERNYCSDLSPYDEFGMLTKEQISHMQEVDMESTVKLMRAHDYSPKVLDSCSKANRSHQFIGLKWHIIGTLPLYSSYLNDLRELRSGWKLNDTVVGGKTYTMLVKKSRAFSSNELELVKTVDKKHVMDYGEYGNELPIHAVDCSTKVVNEKIHLRRVGDSTTTAHYESNVALIDLIDGAYAIPVVIDVKQNCELRDAEGESMGQILAGRYVMAGNAEGYELVFPQNRFG